MRDTIEARLRQLRDEQERGRRMLADLEREQARLRETLLRIGGAVQVLEELLAEAEAQPAEPVVQPAEPLANGLVPA
ncbi:MAG TPA: hypothetical protein PKD53_03515 [Chloroflexaceae bacterium]|mgnify:CR=1 FL=1|nr:hypothetical protein [Chloroflexaceae bacterium]